MKNCMGMWGGGDGKWTHKPTALLRVMAFGALMLYDNINQIFISKFVYIG